jgi:hypothetical protein
MKCPNCGKELSDSNLRFCTFCGAKLAAASAQNPPRETPRQQYEAQNTNTDNTSKNRYEDEPEFNISDTAKRIKNSVKHGVNDIKEAYNTKYTSTNSIINTTLAPCDGERPVRQYRFMKMNLPIIGYKADASIQVTNKRILYHAIGTTVFGGKEESYSEFSIDDVSGISIERSTSLNIPILLAFLLINIILIPINFFFTVIGAGSALKGVDLSIIPIIFSIAAFIGAIVLCKKKYYGFSHIVNSVGQNIAVGGMIACFAGNWSSSISSYLGYSSGNSGIVSKVLLVLIILCIGVMYWITLIMSLFKKNISVVVTSKSGASNAIDCSSNKSWLFGMNNLKSLIYFFETEEFPVMEAELGAMVSDIQKMGDYGIEKWSR